jgi:DNA-binding GntR family transcriptional regulator
VTAPAVRPPTLSQAVLGQMRTALTVDDIGEISLISRLLEAELVRLGVPEMDDTGIARMRSLLARLRSPESSASVGDIAALHQEFHFIPMEYARMPRIETALRRLWVHTYHYRALYLFSDREAMRRMNDDHARIVAACASRDAELAIQLMDEHRQHALGQLAEHVRRRGATAQAGE